MGVPLVSIIVIGRNEGDRLLDCLSSVQRLWVPENATVEITYVDSNSSDGSVERVEAKGIAVVKLEGKEFNAAKARNAGWRQAHGSFILFLDGGTIVDPNFLIEALPEFSDESVAVVTGQKREGNPTRNIYCRALDLEWIAPIGRVRYCGGDALMRRWLLDSVGGYDETLVAGEEPDLCHRLRGSGYQIIRLDIPMTRHFLAMNTFVQYWKRAYKSGYAYAKVSQRYSKSDDPLWLYEARHNIVEGGCLLLLALMALIGSCLFISLLPLFIYGCLFVTLALKSALFTPAPTKSWFTLFIYGLHSHFQHLPLFFGQLGYWIARGLRREKREIF